MNKLISGKASILALTAAFAVVCLLLGNTFFKASYVLATGAPTSTPNGNPGSIWTTNVSCGGVNINLFAAKTDVYLNGGPQGGSPNGLPDGNYWVKVTEPNGTLLGITSSASAVVTSGHFASCYNLFTLTNFADSSNNGDEYKVWVSMDSTFDSGDVKTDNFKVGSSTPTPSGSPSPTPTPCIDRQCPTATPTSTPVATPTPTTPSCGADEHLNLQGTACLKYELGGPPTGGNAPQGQVLGASTMAGTGSFDENLYLAIMSVGGILTSFGIKNTARALKRA